MAYEVYMSDSLNLLAKTVGRIEGGGALSKRYLDWVRPSQNPAPEQHEQTAEEIYAKFLKDLGG